MNIKRPCTSCKSQEIAYVSRGLCRRCNDKRRAKIRWKKIKDNPDLHKAKKRENKLRARKRREDPLVREKDREQCKKWYRKNIDYRKIYYQLYYESKKEWHRWRSRETLFSGLYKKVLERDDFTCMWCGKSFDYGKTNRKLHVHHKDRDTKNNTMENLVTLCSMCHIGHHKTKTWAKEFQEVKNGNLV